jgi:hypothetical protein
MCYTEQALINPVPVLTYASLNGEELQIDDINANYLAEQREATDDEIEAN